MLKENASKAIALKFTLLAAAILETVEDQLDRLSIDNEMS